MGKPSSYLFCRMHDMRSAFFDENGEFKYITLCMCMPKTLEKFANNHPDFSRNDAVLALCAFVSLDNSESRIKYKQYTDQYDGNDMTQAMEDVLERHDEIDKLLEANPTDTSIIYLMAYCLGTIGRSSPEAMAAAHGLMNRVLDMEEQGTINPNDELLAWDTLALYLNFEEAHDRSFGSPIIGNSPFNGKDSNGNPIKQNNANYSSQNNQSSSSGGCYVATAVYGSYDCPQVWTLRRYRDYDLATHWYGRVFIRVYYAISPTIVKWFGDKNWFNRLWRHKLDGMIERLQINGYSSAPYHDKNWKL